MAASTSDALPDGVLVRRVEEGGRTYHEVRVSGTDRVFVCAAAGGPGGALLPRDRAQRAVVPRDKVQGTAVRQCVPPHAPPCPAA